MKQRSAISEGWKRLHFALIGVGVAWAIFAIWMLQDASGWKDMGGRMLLTGVVLGPLALYFLIAWVVAGFLKL